jgi:hypothetical protein
MHIRIQHTSYVRYRWNKKILFLIWRQDPDSHEYDADAQHWKELSVLSWFFTHPVSRGQESKRFLIPDPNRNAARLEYKERRFQTANGNNYIVIFRGTFCSVQTVPKKSVAFCKYFLLFTFFIHQKLWYLARLFWIAMKTRILPDLKLSFRTASWVSEYFRMDRVR